MARRWPRRLARSLRRRSALPAGARRDPWCVVRLGLITAHSGEELGHLKQLQCRLLRGRELQAISSICWPSRIRVPEPRAWRWPRLRVGIAVRDFSARSRASLGRRAGHALLRLSRRRRGPRRGVYALIALAFVVVYKASGMINFALGEWVMYGSRLAAVGLHAAGLGPGGRPRLRRRRHGGARAGLQSRGAAPGSWGGR
jgi:hypothetical protein